MKYFFLFLLLFLGKYSVCAQHMISKQLPFFYQLSSNEIFDIYQDKEGYLWIGTTNGLARYDGFRLQPFRADYKNLNLLTNNSISNIMDNDHYVWIGTWKGLNLYDKQTCKITPFPDARLLDKGINYMPNVCATLSFGLGGIQYNSVTQKDADGNKIGSRKASNMRFRLNIAAINFGMTIHLWDKKKQ